jgi:DNA mismatch endonuclease (patch repair protein)
MPSSNISYWNSKIEKNKIRGKKITKMLKTKGWHAIRIWEHEIKAGKLSNKLNKIMKIARQGTLPDCYSTTLHSGR